MPSQPYIARPPHNSQNQTIASHLQETGEIASSIHPLARLAGNWHDLGKYHPDWQRYIRDEGKPCPHALHGAVLAWQKKLPPVALAIYGHHAGLPRLSRVKASLKNSEAWSEIAAIATGELGEDFFTSIPYNPGEDRFKAELLTRMIFSALIDADRESAARFSQQWEEVNPPSLSTLIQSLQQAYGDLEAKAADTTVNRIRKEISQACLTASQQEPGFFRLTTPTGGGKTLSSLAFALHHAQKYGQERVICCPPFTSIIEQSAQVYRQVLGAEAVLEHHSGVVMDSEGEELKSYQLSAQRWDYPIIVSTTVQLLESLFSRHPSRCRKVHRIANSVILLDEVQTLPTKYLCPIMRMLQQLVEEWHCSVVLSSATQPWYGVLNLPQIRDIIPSEQRSRHFQILKRVDYHYQPQNWTWQDISQDISDRHLNNALIVVNTKADAREGWQALSSLGNTFHLSTNLYPLHRRRILEEIRTRLQADLPVYLVSTQLIEAGVDIDFAAGYRAIAGLDSLIQTAGRVNRNAKQKGGSLTIFELQGGGFPGEQREKIDITRRLLLNNKSLHDEASCQEYFQSFLGTGGKGKLDTKDINKLRQDLDFEEVDQAFQMIEEDKIPVVIAEESKPQELIKQEKLTRQQWRELGQYSVNIKPQQQFQTEEILPGLRVWQGEYHSHLGIEIG